METSARLLFALLAVVLFTTPLTTQAQTNLTDGDGFLWDIHDTTFGDVLNGTTDAYDGWPQLCVTTNLTIAATTACTAAEIYTAGGMASTTALAGRELITAPVTIAGLSVSRRVYVPSTAGEGWARFLEVLSNTSGASITVRIRIGSVTSITNPDLGSDFDTVVVATSDGTGVLSPGLTWFTTDDATSGGGDPSLGHLIDLPGGVDVASVQQDVFSLGEDGIFWEYANVTVPAGATVMLMHFETQQDIRTAAESVTTALLMPSAEALMGVTVSTIINWGSPTVCGDGVMEGAEECDDGNTDDDDACTAACRNAICGDSIIYPGMEECDDGPANSDSEVDACRTTCVVAGCGDSIVDTGEMCDDGNMDDTDVCTNMCAPASCGDGSVEAGTEECDDGNADDTDACTSACTDAVCGDSLIYAGMEECDVGAANSDTDVDGCRTDCMSASCGDSVVDTGESCDEGSMNGTGPGACLADCSGVDMGTSDGGTGDTGVGTDGGGIDTGVGTDGGGIDTGGVGVGTRRGGSGCSCRVGPPSPANPRALALLAVGLGGLLARRRRRR